MKNSSDLELSPKELRPYEFNNRTHPESQVTDIARSIKEFGFNQPIVVDENNEIIIGHGRWMAANQLQLAKVPVRKLTGISEEQKRQYRILDNKLQNDSGWQFDNLNLELDWLEDNDVDLTDWGLDELRFDTTEENEVTEDAGPGEAPAEPWVKFGDYIELGRHELLCGDSTKEKVIAQIDLIVTDPPYGVAYVGKTKDALTIDHDDLDEEQLKEFWEAALDIIWDDLKEGGSVYVSAPSGPIGLVFANSLHQREVLRQILVWNKHTMVLGRSDYHYKHEAIMYGWKPGAAHYWAGGRDKTSVLDFNKPNANRDHPTMKPVELWAELIRHSSRKGETVYDPFMGSGTTIIACEQLGRKAVGMEYSPKYCQVIIDRYRNYMKDSGKEAVIKVNGEVLTEWLEKEKSLISAELRRLSYQVTLRTRLLR